MDLITQASKGVTVAALKHSLTAIGSVYRYGQLQRVENFIKSIETRYYHMTEEDQRHFNEFVKSHEGKVLMGEFIASASETHSLTAAKAMALLYLNDPDFSFDNLDREILVSGILGITDDLIDFFIHAVKLQPLDPDTVYPKHLINNHSSGNWDAESIFIYIEDLKRRRLLAPDPTSSDRTAMFGSIQDNKKDNWSVTYGVTSRSKKMATLFEKAQSIPNSC